MDKNTTKEVAPVEIKFNDLLEKEKRILDNRCKITEVIAFESQTLILTLELNK